MSVRLAHPLYVIRHGETDWNREKRFQGQTDIPLNDLGRTQARTNGETLSRLGVGFDAHVFISSPLSRAAETMHIARAAMGLPAGDFTFDDRLKEVSYGDWESHTLAELKAAIPDEVKRRSRDKWRYTPPNGESYAQLCTRVEDFLGGLDKPAVVATHGGVLRALFHLFEGVAGPEAAIRAVPQDRVYAVIDGRGDWLDELSG